MACQLEQLEARKLLSAELPNILPLGDSITESLAGHASYRYWLWNSLADAGYTANFVGTGAGVGDGAPLYPGFDSDHEGHSGWRADDIQAQLEDSGWQDFMSQPQNTPDIALLHIGSNDVEQGQSDNSTRDEISRIIDDLRVINPDVTVLVAQVIPENTESMNGLNSLLPALASAKNTTRSRVVLVDQSSGFDPATDTFDGVHPNESGEKKMSAKWFAAVTPFLPAPSTQPTGTYLDTPAVPLTGSTNPVGPVEYELSNGNDNQYDGQMLSLRGQKFMRGFGVHANSELTFNLSGGNYSRFRATVGVDDEVEGLGSVVFQVFVNNESTPRFSTETLTGTDEAVPVDVDISGATSLRLVANDAGNDNDFDHADWALARLIVGSAPTNPGNTDNPPPPIPVFQVPAAARKLRAKFHGHRVDLSWKDSSRNESGFRIQRKTGANGTWQQIANLGRNSHAYRDAKVSAGARYYYRVFSYNAAGVSKASNVDDERIPAREKKVKKVKHTVSRIAEDVIIAIKKVVQPGTRS